MYKISSSHGLLVSRGVAASGCLLGLTLAQHSQGDMGSLLATHQHGSEGWAHTGGAVQLQGEVLCTSV